MLRAPRVGLPLALAMALLALAACGGDDDAAAPEAGGTAPAEAGGVSEPPPPGEPMPTADGRGVVVPLDPQGGSGRGGSATLTPASGGTRVVLELTPAEIATASAHVHPGNCIAVGTTIAYPLAAPEAGRSETVLEAPLADLRTGLFAIDVHEGAPEDPAVACGTIPAG